MDSEVINNLNFKINLVFFSAYRRREWTSDGVRNRKILSQ